MGCVFNFSKMVVYPLAGDAFTGDLSGFVAMGIKVDRTRNLMFMKVPIVGSAAFVKEWVRWTPGVVTAARGGVFAKGCGGCV